MTTIVAGTYLANFDADLLRFWQTLKYRPGMLRSGVPFALTLMAILAAHELGHYLLSRHHGVKCSLPYFLPGPNLLGTFGAVIFMKSSIPDRRALFDIGAAGPLAGLVAAVFAAAVGLANSEAEYFIPGAHQPALVLFDTNILLGLLADVWSPDAANAALAGHPYSVGPFISSPLLDAACVGFLVTTLNLMPIGQLDGGHIAYAVLGRRSYWLSIMFLALIMAMGVAFWPPWIFLAAFLFLLVGRKGFVHPPPLFPAVPLTPGRKVMAVIVLLLFLSILSPAPVNIIELGVVP